MKLTTSPALHFPRVDVKRLRTPGAVKPKAPKLVKVSVVPGKSSTGGWAAHATHHMSDGSSQSFSFTDPMKFGTHLKKITGKQWLHPGKNEGAAIAHSLDVG